MKIEKSVGAIVYNQGKVLLLKYGMGHWGLVKGNIERAETKRETIFRELREETGIEEAEIINGFEENTEYYYKIEGETIHKFVTYFLIRAKTQDIQLSFEHDDYDWLTFDKAIKRVDFNNVKKIIKKAREILD
ncbi:MAG: NUDIX domain-containing protein [Candidatus Lokiarchaeota archaeon]|nr:NUDIX domain-containing protein [Candidatus Lokiarchaeota archaeon]